MKLQVRLHVSLIRANSFGRVIPSEAYRQASQDNTALSEESLAEYRAL